MASIVLLVGGIGLSIWMPIFRAGQAVTKIESLGGRVVGMENQAGPERLRQIVGNQRMDAYYGVHSVDLSRTVLTDNDLAQLSALARLQTLYLNGTAVTDNGLARWRGMNNLRALYLYDTAVTDKGVAELKKTYPRCDIRR
jgi:hypothetical protein